MTAYIAYPSSSSAEPIRTQALALSALLGGPANFSSSPLVEKLANFIEIAGAHNGGLLGWSMRGWDGAQAVLSLTEYDLSRSNTVS